MSPVTSPATDVLRADLRRRAFSATGRASTAPRVGLEVEVLPVDAGTGRPATPAGDAGPSTLALLRSLARDEGWSEGMAPTGTPVFRTDRGGKFSFEPGGQIEYSSRPWSSIPELRADVEGAVECLSRAAADAGVELHTRGIDETTPPEDASLVLDSPRYRRLAGHLERIGPAGRRMMLQTAAIHVNVDLGGEPLERWRLANALVPPLVALFANSPRHRGGETGFRSYRSQQWRELDRARSGVFGHDADPVESYLEFALDAEAILLGPGSEASRPFRAWLEEGGTDREAWRAHLSTLFPEVRPRGYLEVRAVDALPPRWYAVPLVFLTGLLYDPEARRRAGEICPPATEKAVARAGREGLADPTLRGRVRELFAVALEGARRLGDFVDGTSLERARAYRDRYLERGCDPGGDPEAGRIPGPGDPR